jgi:hypothetical protein
MFSLVAVPGMPFRKSGNGKPVVFKWKPRRPILDEMDRGFSSQLGADYIWVVVSNNG